MAELKPCPFCGGKARKFIALTSMTIFFCKKCGADVCFYGNGKEPKATEDAIEAWNRRVNNG